MKGLVHRVSWDIAIGDVLIDHRRQCGPGVTQLDLVDQAHSFLATAVE